MDGVVTVLLLVLAGVAVLTPPVAFALSVRPTRATAAAGRACLAVAGLLGALLVAFAFADHGGIDAEGREHGDDSGVALVMGALIVLAAGWNLLGWAVARVAVRRRGGG